MRICTFSLGGDPRVGVLFGEKIADLRLAYALSFRDLSPMDALERAEAETPLTCEDFLASLESGRAVAEDALAALRQTRRQRKEIRFDGMQVVYDPADVHVLPPIVSQTLFCMARNYAAHAAEMAGSKIKDFKEELPLYCFLKPPTSVSGPYDPITVSPAMDKLDYELELGVLIGRGGRHIPKEKAMSHVGGYTLFNDMSDRGTLGAGGRFVDWYAMKAPDGFAPVGPYILLPEKGVDPHKLRLRLWVNGELRQKATTGDMVWKIDEQIAYLSSIATLQPGDIIATGSPPGNAAVWGKYLEAGDVIEGEIQKIGRQRFEIRAEKPRYTLL